MYQTLQDACFRAVFMLAPNHTRNWFDKTTGLSSAVEGIFTFNKLKEHSEVFVFTSVVKNSCLRNCSR